MTVEYTDKELVDLVEQHGYTVLPGQPYGWLVTASPDNPARSARGAGPTWRAAVSAVLWEKQHPQMGRVTEALV